MKTSAQVAPKSTPAKAQYNPWQISKRRKIGIADVQGIAELCAMRLTEKEACIHLGICYEAWRTWKARHNSDPATSFDNILSLVRTKKIHGLIKGIERHGVGADGLRADWRALDRCLVICDQRYSDRAPATVEADTAAIADDLLARMIARAYNVTTDRAALPAPESTSEARLAESSQVVDVQAVETKEGN